MSTQPDFSCQFILQTKTKRKNSSWRDYMLFDCKEDAVRQYHRMLGEDMQEFLAARYFRVVIKENRETLIISNDPQ